MKAQKKTVNSFQDIHKSMRSSSFFEMDVLQMIGRNAFNDKALPLRIDDYDM